MSKRDKLFSLKKPYKTKESDTLFYQAVKENCIFQYEHNKEYKRILNKKGFSPYKDLNSYDDIAKIPFIPTLYFKKHEMLSMPKRKMLISATSSGTSGNKSHIGFNFKSLWRGLKMVISICRYHKLLSLRPARYIIFGYEYNRKVEMAIAKTAFGFTFFAPAKSRDYAIRYDKKEGYKLDLENIKAKLIKYSKGKTPIRTIGFPAYTYFLLKQMKEEGLKIKLPKGSKLTLGGGWKQFYAEKVEKEDFYALVKEVLGLEDKDIVEFFGAVEHPILWTDCRSHHFHVPVYTRVIIRDPFTLEPLPPGKIGLINLVTPMVDSVPLLSIMTDDLGILHEEKCPCGEVSPYLEIIGRVGIKDIVTCASGAEEYLKKEVDSK